MKRYPAIAWFLAITVAAYSWFPEPSVALAVGILGIALQIATERRDSAKLLKLAATLTVCWIFLYTGARILSWSLLTPESSLILLKFLSMSGVASVALVVIPTLTKRWPVIVPLELIALGSPIIWLLAAHRKSPMDQPSWLAEPIFAEGWQTTPIFYLTGLVMAALLLGVYGCRVQYHIETKTLALPAVLAAVLIMIFFDYNTMPALVDEPYRQSLATSPRNEQEETSHPVALIVFYDDFSPELGSYYFRTDIAESVQSRNKTLFESRKLRLRVAVLAPELPELSFERTSEQIKVANPDPKRFHQVYEIMCQTPTSSYTESLDDPPPSPVPEANVQVHNLALEAVEQDESQSPLALGFLVQRWLEVNRSQAEGTLVDKLSDFLIDNQPGTQRVFAQACAEMTRSLGIKSRLVHGFAVPSRLKGSSSYLLIESQHERWWCEIWVPSRGWTVLDPVALDSPSEPGENSSRQLQTELGEAVRTNKTQDRTSGLPTPFVRLLVLASSLFLLGHTVKAYRQLLPYLGNKSHLTNSAYRACLDTLAGVGMVRREGETRLAFAERISSEVPSFEGLTTQHLQSVWGKGGPISQEAVFRTMGQVKRELRHSVPLKRRLLGAVNPFNWTSVR